MATILDEIALREPRLWLPKQGPTGKVRIDFDNPIAKGLIIFYLPGLGVEVVQNIRHGGYETSSYANPTREMMGCESTSQTAGGAWLPYHPSWQRLAVNTTTMLVRMRKDSGPSYGAMISFPYGTGAWTSPYSSLALLTALSEQTPAFNLGTSGSQFYITGTASSWPIDAVNIHNYCVVRNGNSASWFKGTTACGTATVGSTAAPTINTSAAMSIMNRSHYATGDGYDGNMQFAAVWNRCLSVDELAELNADPYQLLIPA